MRFARSLLSMALFASLFPVVASAQVHQPMPVVQRIEPTSGPPGTSVNLMGRFFAGDQSVWLGGAQLEVVSRMPNRWTVRIPANAQSGALEVRTPRGNVAGPRFRVTEAAPTPVISGLAPTSGAAGTEVLISGDHFSPRVSENQVFLGERAVVVRSANPTELHVIVPSDATSAPFRVIVTGAGEATSAAAFTIGTGTSIASFEPTLGPPRTRVTIRGTGFHRSASRVRVYLGESRARVVRASETELQVEVPRGATSDRWLVDVRGGGRAYSQRPFDVRFPPTISAMEPDFGAPGTHVTLTGEHFGADVREVQARLGETPLAVRDLAEGRLVVEIPPGATTGHVEVTVAGLGPGRSRGELRVTEHVAVTSFAPTSGGAGSEVTIRGRGFSTTLAQDHVTISGQPAEVVRATAEEIVVRMPDVASGPLVVAVDNAGEDRTAQPFVMTRVPVIASFEPTTGPPGATVTIHGHNFGSRRGLIRVQLGSRNAQVVDSSDTELRVIIPSSAETGRFRVTVRLQGATEAGQDFTVTAAQ